MQYFITGASGFIGKRLVRKLLESDDSIVYFLVREAERDAIQAQASADGLTMSEWARRRLFDGS